MLLNLLQELLRLKTHYTKAPNRQYSRETNTQKLHSANNLRAEFNREFSTLNKLVNQSLKDQFDDKYAELLNLIYQQHSMSEEDEQEEEEHSSNEQEEEEHSSSEHEEEDMSNFTIDIGLKLPTLNSGKDLEIRDFLNVVSATHDLLNDAGKAALINYVVKAKVQSHCKTKIESVQINTLAELQNALYTRVKAADTHYSLQQKLINATYSSRLGISAFASRLESIATQMSEIEIRTQTPANGALGDDVKISIKETQMRFALNHFRSQVPDHIKTLLDASNPLTLSSALALAASASNMSVSSNVYHTSSGEPKKKFNKQTNDANASKNKKKNNANNANNKTFNKHKSNDNKKKQISMIAESDDECESKN